MRRISMLAVMMFLFSCTRERENGTSTTSLINTPEGAAIEQRLKDYYQDMSDRNWEKYRGHFWKHATITTVWQQPGTPAASVDVTTIDDFIRETPNGPDSKPIFEERMTDSKITVQRNIAQAWVNYKAKFGTPDSLMHWTGVDVFTLLRHNGEWKIVSLVFESDEDE